VHIPSKLDPGNGNILSFKIDHFMADIRPAFFPKVLGEKLSKPVTIILASEYSVQGLVYRFFPKFTQKSSLQKIIGVICGHF
jgi:hypothetical protein